MYVALTFCPSPHASPFLYPINGVHTNTVKPPRNPHTEYAMNISGACHVNTIFLRGRNRRLPSASASWTALALALSSKGW